VGSLNLCLKTPDSIQKESAQSDHPALGKCPKCGISEPTPKYPNISAFIIYFQV
jgi:hypothetical protein